MLHSLHNVLTLLHKYTTTGCQRKWPNPRVWSASPLVWGAFRSTMFWSTKLGHMLPQHWRFPPALGAIFPAFTPLRGVGFIALRLRRLFKWECRQGWRYFWQMSDTCGLRPCAWTHLKMALCQTRSLIWLNPRDTAACDSTCVVDRFSLLHWTLSFPLTNYCLTRFTYFCNLNIYVFLSIFLCFPCLSFASITTPYRSAEIATAWKKLWRQHILCVEIHDRIVIYKLVTISHK